MTILGIFNSNAVIDDCLHSCSLAACFVVLDKYLCSTAFSTAGGVFPAEVRTHTMVMALNQGCQVSTLEI